MVFPVTVPVMTLEIKSVMLSDTQPTASTGYEVALLKDLTYTKVWIEFKIIV